nr:cytochrome bd ubiquinol oxidase 14kDa subunit [Viscum album]
MAIGPWLKYHLSPKRNWIVRKYANIVGNRLRRYGLRYDDLFDPLADVEVKVALDRLPPAVVAARTQRLMRAMDHSLKHTYLPEDLQAVQTPFRSYLYDMRRLIKKENKERKALGALPLVQRTIP